MSANEEQKQKYLEKINTHYLVQYVVIGRNSSAERGLAARNSWCSSQRMQDHNSNRIKWRALEAWILFCPFRAFPKFRTSCRDFFLFGVKWYINSSFLAFISLSLYIKALRTNKLWISLRAHPMRRFFRDKKQKKCRWYFEEFLRLLD